MYSSPDKRTTTTILRLHNVSFEHGMLCSKVFSNPNTHTRRALFGRYYHSLTTHAPIVYRMTAPSSLHAEKEERMFNQLKQITLATSSRRPNDIIKNALLRVQEKANKHLFHPEVSEMTELASTLPTKKNTTFSWKWIKENAVHYQSHLERISDYLECKLGIWWDYCTEGVVFFDTTTNVSTKPTLKHFRSNTTRDILSALERTWASICSDDTQIPTHDMEEA